MAVPRRADGRRRSGSVLVRGGTARFSEAALLSLLSSSEHVHWPLAVRLQEQRERELRPCRGTQGAPIKLTLQGCDIGISHRPQILALANAE